MASSLAFCTDSCCSPAGSARGATGSRAVAGTRPLSWWTATVFVSWMKEFWLIVFTRLRRTPYWWSDIGSQAGGEGTVGAAPDGLEPQVQGLDLVCDC